MNLEKMFETQKVLRERIIKEHNLEGQDLFPNTILALLTELGECANEWRGFKHWSTDQNARTFRVFNNIEYNPLLEEYVDGLSFVLEIGIEIAEEIRFDVRDYFIEIEDEIRGKSQKSKTTTEQFNYLFYLTSTVGYDFDFSYLFAAYYHLGEMLGFTWEQIEQAYYDKNKINHERQTNGY